MDTLKEIRPNIKKKKMTIIKVIIRFFLSKDFYYKISYKQLNHGIKSILYTYDASINYYNCKYYNYNVFISKMY